MALNVLLFGKTARADCIAEALKKTSDVNLYSYMDIKNPGVIEKSEKFKYGNLSNFDSINDFIGSKNFDFAFLGPDDAIALGIADYLESFDIPSIGPKKQLGQLETSKSFTRKLLKKYKIPANPEFKIFKNMTGIQEFMNSLEQVVIKPDGLTGGKGVKVQGDHFDETDEILDYCEEILKTHTSIIIEEKLEGEEFSLQSFTDGLTVLDTIPIQDHKRAYVGDKGPNCGGMGSYSCEDHKLPFLEKDDIEKAHEINTQVVKALYKKFNDRYKGIIYGNFIKTKNGIKLIECNARGGDSEIMNLLPIMKTLLTDVCLGITNNSLDELNIEFKRKATVCKYVVPQGYPDNPQKNQKVDISNLNLDNNTKMYFGAVNKKSDGLYMTGSRAIAIVGIGNSLSEAEQLAESAVRDIKGPVFHREDIGTEKLIQKRVEHMDYVMKS